MSTFVLKIIALLTMLIDHIGEFFPAPFTPILLRQIGRISAPLFVFATANGIKHTSNIKKYILRLYIGSAVMGIGNFILINIFPENTIGIRNNIFATLMLIVIIGALDKLFHSDKKSCKKYFTIFALSQLILLIVNLLISPLVTINTLKMFNALFPNILTCEGGLEFVFLGYMLYKYIDNKKQLSIFYSIFCTVFFAIAVLSGGFNYQNLFHSNFQWLMILSLPFMLMYNGKKGYSHKLSKDLFYWFYPLHIWILFIISSLIIFQ